MNAGVHYDLFVLVDLEGAYLQEQRRVQIVALLCHDVASWVNNVFSHYLAPVVLLLSGLE